MTKEIFTFCLAEWNEALRKRNAHIVLIVDNCSAHTGTQAFTNIKLLHLPSNVTSIGQPKGEDIIRSFKASDKQASVSSHVMDSTKRRRKRKDFLDIVLIIFAWKSLIPQTIVNCFRHAGHIPASMA